MRMERVLQAIDECDDALAACRQWWLGSATKIAVLLASAAAAGLFVVALLRGAAPVLLMTCTAVTLAAAALSVKRRTEAESAL